MPVQSSPHTCPWCDQNRCCREQLRGGYHGDSTVALMGGNGAGITRISPKKPEPQGRSQDNPQNTVITKERNTFSQDTIITIEETTTSLRTSSPPSQGKETTIFLGTPTSQWLMGAVSSRTSLPEGKQPPFSLGPHHHRGKAPVTPETPS